MVPLALVPAVPCTLDELVEVWPADDRLNCSARRTRRATEIHQGVFDAGT